MEVIGEVTSKETKIYTTINWNFYYFNVS